ncbi:MAG: tRNA 2-selenouridine(34) synthase MnmH [Cyanobacteriota bacterium]|nr:tRNA 2-selenouridine(34) synthase MnmH [Cyanobacteriota bacterium]
MSAESLPSETLAALSPDAVAGFAAADGRQAGPLIDVRSPAEYAQGHIPGALNVPLFDDDERAQVGTLYKQQGRQTAVLQGLAAVGPRLEALASQLLGLAGGSGAPVRLYCWRGGMRSASVAWLADTVGLRSRLLPGGYKAFRRWALDLFTRPLPLLLLGGRTGSGKTDVLLALQACGGAVVDLEGLAHHRGSSFGGLGLPPQPSSEHYENRLALTLHRQRGLAPIWLEAESAQVGRCRIPAPLWQQMQQAPVVELQRSTRARVQRLVAVYGHQGANALQEATLRISKRLGPQRTQQAMAAIAAGDMATACEAMLDYYDRCYDHELQSRRSEPLLQLMGDTQEDGELAATLLRWQQSRTW